MNLSLDYSLRTMGIYRDPRFILPQTTEKLRKKIKLFVFNIQTRPKIKNIVKVVLDQLSDEISYKFIHHNDILQNFNNVESVFQSDEFHIPCQEEFLDISIKEENLRFIRCNKISTTSQFFIYENKYFLKKPYPQFKKNLEWEIHILKILSQYNHFPKLITYTSDYMVTEYLPETINEHNMPSDVHSQIKEILEIMRIEGINHNDIKPHELLIKNGILYLVDFGFATIRGKYIPNQIPIQVMYEDKVAMELWLNKILELQRKYFLPKLINKK